ncbi:MAG: monovalent cation/H+ antiporter subunit D, partial [Natronospirillum sp.]
MLEHWPVFPVLLPLFTGALLIFLARSDLDTHRFISLLSALVGVPVAAVLLVQAQTDAITVYAMGNWAAPFGIVLVVDRLSALLMTMTAVLAYFALLFRVRGDD